MRELRKGDLVRVRKRQPKWENQHPIYTGEMLVFANLEYIVIEEGAQSIRLATGLDDNYSKVSEFVWREQWLEFLGIKEQLIQFSDEEFEI